jgi:hypothetical protein
MTASQQRTATSLRYEIIHPTTIRTFSGRSIQTETLLLNDSYAAVTIGYLGSTENFNKLMSIVEEYNKNEADLLMKATELKTDTDQSKFNHKNCLKHELLVQHFVKSSPHFIASQWYLQDYVMTRLMGNETDIADIL